MLKPPMYTHCSRCCSFSLATYGQADPGSEPQQNRRRGLQCSVHVAFMPHCTPNRADDVSGKATFDVCARIESDNSELTLGYQVPTHRTFSASDNDWFKACFTLRASRVRCGFCSSQRTRRCLSRDLCRDATHDACSVDQASLDA